MHVISHTPERGRCLHAPRSPGPARTACLARGIIALPGLGISIFKLGSSV